jgi:RNA polymerase sigma-70 factor, ECF subfamily
MPDSDLVKQILAGSDSAGEQLIQQHQEAVFRLAYLLLGDADDAEDVAQETFIRALRHLHNFDIERPLRPWLLRISANLARNRRRALGRYIAALQRFWRDYPEAITSAENESDQRWETQTVWQAIRRLQTHDQEVIYLRFFLELSVNETAEVLGIAPGTVKSRLHRALNHLRQTMQAEFPALYEGHQS